MDLAKGIQRSVKKKLLVASMQKYNHRVDYPKLASKQDTCAKYKVGWICDNWFSKYMYYSLQYVRIYLPTTVSPSTSDCRCICARRPIVLFSLMWQGCMPTPRSMQRRVDGFKPEKYRHKMLHITLYQPLDSCNYSHVIIIIMYKYFYS